MRTTFLTLASAALFGLSSPASASVVFSDNFDSENGGASDLNYTGFANFSVVGVEQPTGSVDILRSGDFGIACAGGSGSCVDLDGSTNQAGGLRSIGSFAFNTGDFVRLSFDLSGNQRSGSDSYQAAFYFSSDTQINNYGYNYSGSDDIVGNFFTTGIATQTGIGAFDPFATRSIFFTAGNAGSLNVGFNTFGTDNIGPILDNVSLSIGPAAAVPEPASWALMIAGFGLVGGTMRRRQSGAARATA